MIHVKIDLCPFGREDGRKTISQLFIANIGPGETEGTTQYKVWKMDPRVTEGNPLKPDALVLHKREDGCDTLVKIALQALEGEVCRHGIHLNKRCVVCEGL